MHSFTMWYTEILNTIRVYLFTVLYKLLRSFIDSPSYNLRNGSGKFIIIQKDMIAEEPTKAKTLNLVDNPKKPGQNNKIQCNEWYLGKTERT